jgi:hypothetical protein
MPPVPAVVGPLPAMPLPAIGGGVIIPEPAAPTPAPAPGTLIIPPLPALTGDMAPAIAVEPAIGMAAAPASGARGGSTLTPFVAMSCESSESLAQPTTKLSEHTNTQARNTDMLPPRARDECGVEHGFDAYKRSQQESSRYTTQHDRGDKRSHERVPDGQEWLGCLTVGPTN